MRAPQVYFPELMEILHSTTLGKDVMHFLGFALQLACVQAIILLMLLLLQMFLVDSLSKFYVVKCLLLFLGKKRCPSHLAGFWYFPDRGNSIGFSKFRGKGLRCGFPQKMGGLEGAFKVYTFNFLLWNNSGVFLAL